MKSRRALADEFQSKTVWQRVKIAATGPLTNIVLAFIIMPLVFMVGHLHRRSCGDRIR